MSISMLVEKAANGFRAVAGGPFELSAEAASVEAAVAGLRAKINDKLKSGAILIEQSFSPPHLPLPVLSLSENPLFDEWLQAVEDYRHQVDAEEKAATTQG
jgi:hypothetical protein